ncbi:MAG TPA: 1-deoxy-D-xylulose-5-phosphate reductoisomerase [Candidatus Dormibacteraeota bacterium]|nr:1-deoxy-D-xylulose-5-phosphate reductoisomerase [Candidatus Dormibacteraeota bacterium]
MTFARRRVVLLGATGSIGRQACQIIAAYPEHFELVGAVAGSDTRALRAVVEQFQVPRSAVVAPRDPGEPLPRGAGTGVDAACEVAALDADIVLVGIAGAAALRPTLAALDHGTDVGIATKEVLVMAGELVRERARAGGARLIPVDSEHSALWQCLRGEDLASVARLLLTASGGPFRERPLATMGTVTVDEALHHPNWTMGPKITVDSATMMNKGLEIIEAHFLFDVDYASIDVVIHPPSIVHSCVEFVDGATMAQIGMPDMRIPIALALADGRRLPGVCAAAELTVASPLEFHPVDPQRFPAPALARRAGEIGGGAPCVLNAANEAAVAAFLQGRCGFTDIVPLVAETLDAAPLPQQPSLDDLVELDAWARRTVEEGVRAAGAGTTVGTA